MRLGFVLLTLAHGSGLLLYLLLRLVWPKAGQPSVVQQALSSVQQSSYHLASSNRNQILGYILLGVGSVMLIGMLHIPGPLIVVLVIVGGWYLLRCK